MPKQQIQTQLQRLPQITGTGGGSLTGVVDTRLRQEQLIKGLSQFSESLKSFAAAGQKRKIQNDIITARTAFAVNKELPGNLAPEAELAYNNLVAQKSTNQFFRQLKDDAEIFGNGVLTDDETYPDHTSKQLAFEDYIDGSRDIFFSQAQFTDAQHISISDIITEKTDALKNAFSTLAAKDIKAIKLNDSAEFVQENILSQFSSFDYLSKLDDGQAHPDLNLTTYFNDEWHTKLQEELLTANPHLSRDEADLMIIQQLELVATDSDNPKPEILDYLDEKRAKGKPRFTSIETLREKIKSAKNAAQQALITKVNLDHKLQSKLKKEEEELAEEGAMQQMVSVIHETEDLIKLEQELQNQFPNIKSSSLRAVIEHAKKLKQTVPGNPAITARLIQEASSGLLDNLSLEGDPRTSLLNRKQLIQVYGEISKFKLGQTTRNRTRLNDSIKDFRLAISEHLAAEGTIKIGDKVIEAKIADLTFDIATGRALGFSPYINSIIDNLVSQYETSIYNIFEDLDGVKVDTLQQELLKNKENFFKKIGVLGGEQAPIKSKKPIFDVESAFDKEVLDQLEPRDTPEAIIKSQTNIPQTHIPTNNVPVPSLQQQQQITNNFKAVNKVLVDLQKEKVSPKVSPKEPSPILNRAQERAAAFEKAFPETPPSERVQLRELQDKAKFQSDKTILDVIKEFLGPAKVEASILSKAKTAIDYIHKTGLPTEAALEELGTHDQKIFQGKPYFSLAGSKVSGVSGAKRKLEHSAGVSIGKVDKGRFIANPKGDKTNATIGFGHDITPTEFSKGKIYGISFINPDGTFKNLSETDLAVIFTKDFNKARQDAKSFVSNFNTIPQSKQDIITEMVFQMGLPTLKTFKAFKTAIENTNWAEAAKQILVSSDGRSQSVLAKQTPDRAKRYAKQIGSP